MKIGKLINEKVLLTFLCSMISLLALSSILSHIDIKDTNKIEASINDTKKNLTVDMVKNYSKNVLTPYVEPEPEPEPTPEVEVQAQPEQVYVPVAVTGTVSEYQNYARSQFSRYGWSDDDFNGLVQLWNRESGWNPSSHSASGAHGIPQALPGSKMAAYGEDYMTNYVTQINWGLDYISSRYGSPSAAWNHMQSTGWY